MTALTQDRRTDSRSGIDFSHPVAAGAKIYQGALVVLNATGFATGGSTAADLTAAGRALEHVDNTGGADGDQQVRVDRGLFRWGNHDTDTVNRTHIGKPCYVVDDQTVAATDGAGTRSKAGIVRDVDSAGVWVEI